MAPVAGMDIEHDRNTNEEFYFEASILHRIPSEIIAPYSASSITSSKYFNEQSPAGDLYRTWLINKKDRQDQRIKRLTKFQAELMGLVMNDYDDTRATNDPQDGQQRNTLDDRRELLLDIALRTMVLLHHNQQLQNRLTALQIETKNFVRSFNNNAVPTKNWCTTNNNNNSDSKKENNE